MADLSSAPSSRGLRQSWVPAGPLRGTIVSAKSLTDAQIADWERIGLADPDLDHPFLSPGFTRAVAASRPDVFVCVLDDSQGAAGFLPFQFPDRLHRLTGAAEPVGDGMADYFGLIARKNVSLSPEALLSFAGLASFGYHHLPQSQADYGLSGGEAIIGHRMLLGEDPVAYWQELKKQRKSFVAETERRQRKIVEACGPLRFTFAVDNPLEELRLLVARKRAQYRDRKVGDALAAPWKRTLLENLSACDSPHCEGVLSTLHAGDTWVASHFGLRNRKTLHYWFPVYNEELAKFAPGHLLIRQIIENSRSLGLSVIDRGAGDQPHKSVYLTETHNFYKGWWRRPGLRSLAHQAAQSLSWRIQGRARRAEAGEL